MSRAIGINTWVWASPLTDETVTDLLHHVAALGFDAVELPLEASGDLSPEVVGAALEATGLTPYVVGAMAPGRDLVMTDPRAWQQHSSTWERAPPWRRPSAPGRCAGPSTRRRAACGG